VVAIPNSILDVLEPEVKDLGEFFDHIGPDSFSAGQGMDVRPHPHINLATVTYLFEGALLHRDSLEVVQEIHLGAVDWMTAGHGIVHSERSPKSARSKESRLHGIQTWIALSDEHEETEPWFRHYSATRFPVGKTRVFQSH